MTTASATFRPLAGSAIVPAAPISPLVASAPVHTTGERWRPGPGVAGAGSILAIVSILMVHILMIASVDPVRATLSTYGLSARSTVLFAVSCLALAIGAIGLVRHLPAPGRASAYGTAVALALVVIFPTDPIGEALSLSGQIHRYAAGAAFVLLGVLILSAVGRCGATMRKWLWGSIAIVVLMLAFTIAAAFWPDFLAMHQWRGIPQRVLLLVEAGVVGVLGVHWRRAADRSGINGVRNTAVNPAG